MHLPISHPLCFLHSGLPSGIHELLPYIFFHTLSENLREANSLSLPLSENVLILPLFFNDNLEWKKFRLLLWFSLGTLKISFHCVPPQLLQLSGMLLVSSLFLLVSLSSITESFVFTNLQVNYYRARFESFILPDQNLNTEIHVFQ